jgi:hypothetical protein
MPLQDLDKANIETTTGEIVDTLMDDMNEMSKAECKCWTQKQITRLVEKAVADAEKCGRRTIVGRLVQLRNIQLQMYKLKELEAREKELKALLLTETGHCIGDWVTNVRDHDIGEQSFGSKDVARE